MVTRAKKPIVLTDAEQEWLRELRAMVAACEHGARVFVYAKFWSDKLAWNVTRMYPVASLEAGAVKMRKLVPKILGSDPDGEVGIRIECICEADWQKGLT